MSENSGVRLHKFHCIYIISREITIKQSIDIWNKTLIWGIFIALWIYYKLNKISLSNILPLRRVSLISPRPIPYLNSVTKWVLPLSSGVGQVSLDLKTASTFRLAFSIRIWLVHLVSRCIGSFGFLGCSTGSSVGFLLLSVATAYAIVESVTTTTNNKESKILQKCTWNGPCSPYNTIQYC